VSHTPDPGLLEPPYGARDSGAMAGLIGGGARQIEEALERVAAEPWRPPLSEPDLLAVGGLGGSAIAADLTAALFADRLEHPLLVVRETRWPACVTRRSLAVLSSCSGDTRETLALYRDAGERGVPRLVLTRGGALGAAARRDGVQVHALGGTGPPRAALYAGWVPLTGLLHRLGWSDDPAPGWREAADQLRREDVALGPAAPAAGNPAKQLALALHGRMTFIYSGSERLGPVGLRWRQQLHENAKLLGHSAVVPELNHNEIVGWERPGPVRDRAAVVLLRDPEDTREVAARLTLTAEFARRQGAAVHEIEGREGGRIARAARLILWGDYVSFYLALLSGADPTPIASIDEFKRRLAASGPAHAG
jgi:glucose/mannose-6-phosphate isomerase